MNKWTSPELVVIKMMCGRLFFTCSTGSLMWRAGGAQRWVACVMMWHDSVDLDTFQRSDILTDRLRSLSHSLLTLHININTACIDTVQLQLSLQHHRDSKEHFLRFIMFCISFACFSFFLFFFPPNSCAELSSSGIFGRLEAGNFGL